MLGAAMKIRTVALVASLVKSGGTYAAPRLEFIPCSPAHAPASCLVGEDERGKFEIPVAQESPETFVDRHVRRLAGRSGSAPLVAVHFAADVAGSPAPALSVIDLAQRRVLGTARAPYPGLRSYVAYLQGPEGETPVLAPGLGDTPGPQGWGYLCLFRRDAAPAGAHCGPGFLEASTFLRPETRVGSHRELGGLTWDADGDGWEDLELVFHGEIATYSGHTAKLLARTTYDVASPRAEAKAGVFHSGRNYGVLSVAPTAAEKFRVRLVGGIPVGDFADLYCNVSRFAAVLEGRPPARHLAWSHYYGFHSATLGSTFGLAPRPVLRNGDGWNGCLHRFSDATVTLGDTPALAFNIFEVAKPASPCLPQQRRLLSLPAWTAEKKNSWETCLREGRATRGHWRTEWLRESDGATLPGPALKHAYLWGWMRDFERRGETTYFLEALPEAPPYNFGEQPPSPLVAYAYRHGVWVEVGRAPLAARPALKHVSATGTRGVGSDSYLAEFDAQDIDGDGRPEIRLTNGEWLGQGRKGLALKSTTRPLAPASR